MRLIDANKLIEKLSRMIDFVEKDKTVNALNALFQVGDAIMDCPTVDAVPVVRCKDCRYGKKDLFLLDSVRCERTTDEMMFSDFCSYGEPKEET